MEITIREYIEQDKSSCLAAFKSNVPLYFTEEETEDFKHFLQRLEHYLQHQQHRNTYFFVVVYDQKVIGCGGFGDKENKHVISLAWGLIHKDYHKRGFGKKLLLFRLEQIRSLFPGQPVVIDTTQFSYPFFEKNGFYTIKVTNDFYAAGMHRYDMILNEK
jgi:N-acetylglutamate synthase-like GNAT family acetyltransferase